MEGLAGGHQAQPEVGSEAPRFAGGRHCDSCGKDLREGLAGGHQAQPEVGSEAPRLAGGHLVGNLCA